VVWGSWEASVPLLRIDYVFHSAELVALHAAAGPDGGSDHLPMAARLAFR
jgi:endonuclease/exonuclease/phosphatase family metal-dependent hydrolase